jgi:REP element-mobilizing transposase RayT
MENHLHLIAQSSGLSEKIAAFKSFTARKTIDYLKSNGHGLWLKRLNEQKLSHKTDRDYQLWQEGYNPKQVVGDNMLIQKIDYIHNNPVKRGYVDKPECWRYSSARDYTGLPGLIPVTLFRK